jgi:hypothetical protein
MLDVYSRTSRQQLFGHLDNNFQIGCLSNHHNERILAGASMVYE